MVGYNTPVNLSFEDDNTSDKGDSDSAFVWKEPDPTQLGALTKLFAAECVGDTGTVTSDGQWAAYRSGQTSGVYLVEISDSVKHDGVGEFVERAITENRSPIIAMSVNNQLRTVEDWRKEALLCMESSEWRPTNPHETFAYYHFLLNKKAGEVLYLNETFYNTYHFERAKHPTIGDDKLESGSVVLFPSSYFPRTGIVFKTEASQFAMWMKRGTDPSVVTCTRCHIDWKPGPPCEIRPASLVPTTQVKTTNFRARMILGLGVNDKPPDAKSMESAFRKAYALVHPDKHTQKDLTKLEEEKINLRFTTTQKALTSAGNHFHPEISLKFGRGA
jgi:hypothetical protein